MPGTDRTRGEPSARRGRRLRSLVRRLPPIRRLHQEREQYVLGIIDLRRQLDDANAATLHADEHSRASWMRHHPAASSREKLFDESPLRVATGDTDRALVERIIAAYGHSVDANYYGSGSMWNVLHERNAEIHKSLVAGDVPAVTAILRDPSKNYLLFGYEDVFLHSAAQEELVQEHADGAKDMVVRLAEAFGLLRVEDPEGYGYTWGQNMELATDTVVNLIEEHLGMTLPVRPVQRGFTGIGVSDGVITYRIVHAAYAAERSRRLLKGNSSPRVLEVGAGVGYVAHFARQLGILNYTIVDLPLTNVEQAYFLGQSIGEDRIVLEGEPGARDADDDRVKIRTPAMLDETDWHLDLVVNIDSLTEFGLGLASKYAERMLDLAPVILSINHEANEFTAYEVFAGREADIERYPYWLRVGYVEEIIRPGRV